MAEENCSHEKRMWKSETHFAESFSIESQNSMEISFCFDAISYDQINTNTGFINDIVPCTKITTGITMK